MPGPDARELDIDARLTEVKDFEACMLQNVIGQDRAVKQVTAAYQRFMAGLHAPGRPLATLLFLGATGVGKTMAVEAASIALFGKRNHYTKVDCAEYTHGHEVSKLTGSPPGYLGYSDNCAMLQQGSLDTYQVKGDSAKMLNLLLFDEIEKGHYDLHNLLLGILDKGIMRLGNNTVIDFTRTMIFMTSNIGSREVSKLSTGAIGFEKRRELDLDKLDQDIYKTARAAAEKKFSPEFMNRLDRVVVFRSLSHTDMEKVLDLELVKLQNRILDTYSADRVFAFHVEPAARKFLLREGVEQKSGARNLKRVIERYLVGPLANLVSTRQIGGCDTVKIDYTKGKEN